MCILYKCRTAEKNRYALQKLWFVGRKGEWEGREKKRRKRRDLACALLTFHS